MVSVPGNFYREIDHILSVTSREFKEVSLFPPSLLFCRLIFLAALWCSICSWVTSSTTSSWRWRVWRRCWSWCRERSSRATSTRWCLKKFSTTPRGLPLLSIRTGRIILCHVDVALWLLVVSYVFRGIVAVDTSAEAFAGRNFDKLLKLLCLEGSELNSKSIWTKIK